MTHTLESTLARREAPMRTPTALGADTRRDITAALSALLADTSRYT